MIKPQRYLPNDTEWQEKEGVRRFMELAERHNKQFNKWVSTGTGSFVDMWVEDYTGGTMAVENKVRTIMHKKYDDVMIEPSKLNNLLTIYEKYGIHPLYINYYNDGYTYIFDIARIEEEGLTHTFGFKPGEKIKYWEKGVQYTKIEDRYFIPAEYAIEIAPDFTEEKSYDFSTPKITRLPYVISLEEPWPAARTNKLIH